MRKLLILLVPALLVACRPSPAPSAEAGPEARPVAYVNGVAIAGDRLDLAVNALIPQASFHRGVSAEVMARLRRTALEGLIDEELQFQDARARGLAASDSEVDAGLADVAARYESPDAFAAARLRAHLSLEDVRREVRRTVLIRKAHEAEVASRCEVDQAEAARFFEANRARFVVPEELHVQAITIGVDPSSPPAAWSAARDQARQLRSRVLDGADFGNLARQYSTDPSRESGGDMGFVHRGGLAEGFEQATAHLHTGEVSDVVRTIYGYHLVRITEVRPSRQKTFDEVASGLIKDLTEKRCDERKVAWVARLRAHAVIRLVEAETSGLETNHPPQGSVP